MRLLTDMRSRPKSSDANCFSMSAIQSSMSSTSCSNTWRSRSCFSFCPLSVDLDGKSERVREREKGRGMIVIYCVFCTFLVMFASCCLACQCTDQSAVRHNDCCQWDPHQSTQEMQVIINVRITSIIKSVSLPFEQSQHDPDLQSVLPQRLDAAAVYFEGLSCLGMTPQRLFQSSHQSTLQPTPTSEYIWSTYRSTKGIYILYMSHSAIPLSLLVGTVGVCWSLEVSSFSAVRVASNDCIFQGQHLCNSGILM